MQRLAPLTSRRRGVYRRFPWRRSAMMAQRIESPSPSVTHTKPRLFWMCAALISATTSLAGAQEPPASSSAPVRDVHTFTLGGGSDRARTVEHTVSQSGEMAIHLAGPGGEAAAWEVLNAEGKRLGEASDPRPLRPSGVRFSAKAGAHLRINVRIDAPASLEVRITIAELPETETTRKAATDADAVLKRIEESKDIGGRRGARKLLRESVTRTLATPGATWSRSIAGVLHRSVHSCRALGDLRTALKVVEAVERHQAHQLPDGHVGQRQIQMLRGVILLEMGRTKQAEKPLAAVVDALSAKLPPESPELQTALVNYAYVLGALGQPQKACDIERRLLDIRSRTLEDDDPKLQTTRMNLSASLSALGKMKEAMALELKVLEVLKRTEPEESNSLQKARQNVAISYHELGRLKDALELKRQVLDVRLRLFPEEHLEVQEARVNLSATLSALGQLDECQELLEKVLAVGPKHLPPFHPLRQGARGNLAIVLFKRGNFLKAQKLSKQAYSGLLLTRGRTDPHVLEARANMANVTKMRGDFASAAKEEKAVLDVWDKAGRADHPSCQSARMNYGDSLAALGRLDQARVEHERALRNLERALPAESPSIATAKVKLGRTLYLQGELQRAFELQTDGEAALEAVFPPDHLSVQEANESIGATLAAFGRYEEAKQRFEQVLDTRVRTMPTTNLLVQRSRVNLAGTLTYLGDFTRARTMLVEALRHLARYPKSYPERLEAETNLGGVLLQLGEIHRARDLLEGALATMESKFPADHPSLNGPRLNMAGALMRLGDVTGCRLLQEQAVRSLSRLKHVDAAQLQTARLGLASTLYRLEEYEQAADLQQEALRALADRPPGDLDRLRIAGTYAATLLRLDKIDDALARIQAELAGLPDTISDTNPDLQVALEALAAISIERNEFELARKLYERVLVARTSSLPEDHIGISVVRSNLAWTIAASGDAQALRRALEELCATTTARLRHCEKYLAPRRAAAAAATAQREINTVLSLMGHLEDGGRSLTLHLFELVETARGLATTPFRVHQLQLSLDQRLNEEGVRLRGEAAAARQRFAQVSRAPESKSALSSALRARETAQRRYREWLVALPGADALLTPIDAAAVRSALGAAEASLTFWRYAHGSFSPDDAGVGPRYVAFVVTAKRDPVLVDLGSAPDLERRIRDWRRALTAGDLSARRRAALRRLSAEIRKRLLDPVREALGESKTVYLAPDDALHLVPMDALAEGTGATGDHRRFILVPGLDALLRASGQKTTNRLVVVGDVDYAGKPQAAADSRASRRGRSIGISRGVSAGTRSKDRTFAPLPGTVDEVDAIVAHFEQAFPASRESVVLRRSDATKRAFVESLEGVGFLHLATHGWFVPDSVPSLIDSGPVDPKAQKAQALSARETISGFAPMTLCGLALAGANRPGHDGILTAEELAALDMRQCALAVASACESNLGVRRAGQGIASLRRALHVAGVRATITSLWKVPDRATQELMAEFYRRVWRLEESPAEALWAAKQKLRDARDAQTGEPLYTIRDWAPWVLSEAAVETAR